ncbi:MAG: NAD-dependent epimerase/dehydratase family protein [Clostridiales bacterium]|nr:NAD-dependent epimerase/dehydratase family protein [Clostridiales bacterium]
MKLLLIGGSGQLSGRLAQMALAQGHQVWTVTRGIRPLPEGVHSLIADREDPAQLRAALENASVCWDAMLDTVCRTPHHARVDLEAVAPFVRRMVIVSTDSVYSPHHKSVPQDEHADVYMADGGYGHNKRMMEQVFEASDPSVRWTIFRPGHILGPGFWLGCYPENSRQPDLLRRIRSGEPMRLVGGGEFLIHPIFVDDMAQAMLDCLDNPAAIRQIFCIGGPDAVPNRRYYELIGQIIGCPVQIESVPPEGYLEAHPEYSGHLCHRCYTLEKMERAGIPLPRTTLEEGLRKHIAWLDSPEGEQNA